MNKLTPNQIKVEYKRELAHYKREMWLKSRTYSNSKPINIDNSYVVEYLPPNDFVAIRNRDGLYIAREKTEKLCRQVAETIKNKL